MVTFEGRIKELGELKLVGLRVISTGHEYLRDIQKTAKTLNIRMRDIQQILQPENQIGAFIVEETCAEQDGYYVCVQVEDFHQVPKDMITLTIPSQRYAVLIHEGLNNQIKKSFEIIHIWIEDHGYKQLKNKWHLEWFTYQRG